MAKIVTFIFFYLKKASSLALLLLCSQLLQIMPAGAASLTDTQPILLDHTVTRKSEQILHRQAAGGQRQESGATWAHLTLPNVSLTTRLLCWGKRAIYAAAKSAQHVRAVKAADKLSSNSSARKTDLVVQKAVQKNERGASNFFVLSTSAVRRPQIKITSGGSVSVGTTKASNSITLSQYDLVTQFSLDGVDNNWSSILLLNRKILDKKISDELPFSLSLVKEARAQEPVRIKKVGLENKKSASPTQVKTQVRPTVHPLTDKEIQVFRKKLKVNSGTMDSLPRSHNLPNSLLRQQVNERPPVTLSDLPYIGPVAAPLAQWAQSGSLSNISLTSQQLGLNGPLSGGVTYSNVTGVFLNAQYVLPLADQTALGVLGEYGPGQYRLNGTVAYGFTPLSQIKVTGEYLVQRLPFQFDSGSVMQRLHQSAYGVRFQQLFEQPYWQNINLGGYYASAANKDLPPVIFIANGLSYLNERRIAGASSSGIDVGTELLLSSKTLLGGNLYFDRVSYGTQLTGDTGQNRQGLGGGIKLKQLFGGNFKLWGEVSVRKIYDSYEGGISWLPLPKLLGLELSLLGQHVIFHNSMPNNSNISLQVKWLPDSNPHYDEYFAWKNKQLTTVSQWVKTPAIYMPQVLAIAEQITKRIILLAITSVNPNNGSPAGGNTVTITGSHFVTGLMVFFGGQLANGIVVLSPTTLTVEVPSVPGLLVPQPVDVVIESPDGQQAILSNGYIYNGLPNITNIMPAVGPTAGGTLVTITGTSFTGTTSVTFGGVLGTNVTVNGGGTQLTVIAPAGAVGVVNVMVTTPNGSATAANAYTYVAPPTVTGISPSSGPLSGGVPVTITGSGFVNGQTTVTFGGNGGTVTNVSPDGTQMTVITPAGTAANAVDVIVTTPGGSVTQPSGYTYANIPNISSLSPAFGPVAGGTQVTITGTDFTGATSVTFGGVPGTNLSVNANGTQLTVTTPAGTGAVPVVVTSPSGSSLVNPPTTTYTYVAPPTVTGITPSSGPLSGGVPVTISGTGFVNGQTVVLFGGNGGTVTDVNAAGTQLTVLTPAGTTAGPVNVDVTTPGGSFISVGGYTYVSQPNITSISPAFGSVTGGTQVTVTGTDFTGTSVTFGGVPGTNLSVNGSGTQLTVIAPASLAGTVDVIVTTSGGSSLVNPPITNYTYVGVPTISSIIPSAGSLGGGTLVTINGTGFINGQTTVTFGGNGGTITNVSADGTQLTVMTPAGTAGIADVIITTPGGSVTQAGGFTYANIPNISGLSPTFGPVSGGTQVTVTGTNFTGATSVAFGGVLGTNVIVNGSGTQLTVTTPVAAGPAGAVDVEVTTPGGSSDIDPAVTSFTYVAVPTVTGITPSSGSLGGDTLVTISGSGFVSGQTTVTFGGNGGTVTNVNANGTQLTVTTPATSVTGAVDVIVTTPGGSVTQTGAYTYVNEPSISSLSPAFGPVAGGTQVTITGSDLTGATSVTFGGALGTNVTVNGNGTQLTVTAPAGTTGEVQVVVTAPGGSSALNPPATTYTYVAVPTVSGVTPSSGPLSGGVAVTISGSGFVNGQTMVTLGGHVGIVTNVNAAGTQLTVTTPEGNAVGAVDVIVTTPGGSATQTGGYTYVNQPNISSLSPAFGPVAGVTQVTITGTDFTGATSVTFAGALGTNVSVNGNGTQLTVTAPAGVAAGAVQVVVTAPGGSSLVNPPTTSYTYVAIPTVSGVAPSSGPLSGGVPVTISGVGFVSGQTTVTFGGNGGTVTNVSSDGTQLTVITPAGTTVGAVNVVVTTPGGSVTQTGAYTYVNEPNIGSLSPAFGPVSGNTQVTITGTDLLGATSVTFGGVPGSNVSVNGNGTQLTVTAPPSAGGTVQVVVTAPGGSSSLNPPATSYTYVAVPVVTGFSPSSGPLAGGNSVTISGTGFVSGQTIVTFGGHVGIVTNVNANGTQLTMTAPAGDTVGAVDVVLTTPGGSVTQTGGYTYVNEPNISSLSPNIGPLTAGTLVTITGSDLTGATSVTFGGVAGTNVNVNASGTQLTVVAPAGAVGGVQVVVTAPGGSSALNPPTTTYTYIPVPIVTGVTPSSGPLAGGTSVTISGSGFVSGQTVVTFAGNGGTVTNVSSDGTQLTVTTPAGTAVGAVNVVVTTPGGSMTQTGAYTYVNEPSISSLSPSFGSISGGMQVTITGTDLTGATNVTFGGVSGSNINVNGGGTQLTVTTPAHVAGAVQVVVTAPGGSSALNPPATTYTYTPVPTVTGVAPSSGPLGGGNSVTMSGSGFVSGQTVVTFAGNAGTVTNVSSDGTQLTVTVPAGTTVGAANVAVTTPGGSVIRVDGYSYVNQPNISSLSPSFGPLTPGTLVTITGTDLTGATNVTFGGVSGSNISVNGSGTQLTVTAPAGAAGAVQVVVTAPGGSSSINPPASTYTYVASPTVTGISPPSGPLGGGETVIISGSGFVNGQTTITFGGNVGTITNVSTDGTQLTVTTPIGTVGSVDVVVTTPGGRVTQTGAYTYVNIPNISSLTPSFGPVAGGTQVTITGTDFTGVISVTFGGVPGTNVSVNGSGTQLTVTAPAASGPAGRVDVEVTTSGGSSDIDPAVTSYTYVAVPTVTGITPSSGPLGGGNLVTLSGTGFVNSQTVVTFGGNVGTVTSVSANGTQLTVTIPVGAAAGAVNVVVTTPGGSVTQTGAYTYVNQPNISSLSPSFGPLIAGTPVTITGSDLIGTNSVTFGGVAGSNVSVNGNGTQLTVIAPAGAAGAVQVGVTATGGSSPARPPVTTYTYVASPTITGVSPSSGPLAGGTSVTISGTGFVTGRTTVTFAGNNGTVTNVSTDGTQLTVTTPVGSAGPVDVIVTTPGGNVIQSGAYTYVNQPSISSLSPSFGPLTAGKTVTITGTDLTGATNVTFGGVSGSNISVNGSGTQLTVTAPAGAAGAVQVVVTAPGGSSSAKPPATTYTYVAFPTITGVSPSSGPLAGGTSVTISGTGFVTGQTMVTFAGNNGTVANVSANGSQLTVTAPAGTVGPADVTVTTPGGNVTQSGAYTYVNIPNISSLSPSFGPLTAGTQVTITGTDLTGATNVTFGGVSGSNINVNGSGTQLTVTAPAGAAGAVQVVVTAPGGSSLARPPATTYTYVASPTITGVSPSSGPLAGGTSVTISGTGFVTGGRTTVTFGGNGGTVTNVNANGTQLTVTVPAGTAGPVDVVVTTPGGNATQASGYTYVNVPNISSLSPSFGPLIAGTQVTITGTDFTGASSVTFGGALGTNVSVNGSGTQLTVTAPAGTAGAVQVVVTAPGGSSSLRPPTTTYTYVAPPTVTGVTPASGPLGGGSAVTISGTGFVAGGRTIVTFGGSVGIVTNVSANGNQLTVTTPAGSTAGAVDVVVMTPGGNVTQTGGYTYANQPTISSLSPSFGPLTAGTQVTITGTDLTGATSVTFGGMPGNNVSVNGSGTQLTVSAPTGAAGAVQVVVTAPGGSSPTHPPATTYTYVAPPTVTGVSPASGPLAGGTSVTISGTGFVTGGRTTVTFGGNGGTVTNVSANGTQLTVTTPAGSTAGVVDVIVTTPGGNVTQTGTYTYVNIPSISSLSPSFGPLATGTQVTITGTDLTGANSVTFGGMAGSNINVNGSGTQLTVTAPAGVAGAVQVVVTATGGSSPTHPPATTYTYVAAPTITGLSPASGPLGGATAVRITGTGFVTGQTTVTFGGNVGTVTNVSANGTQLTVTTPAGSAAGAVNVVVTTPGGSVTQSGGFAYVNIPSISSLSPNFGPVAGGTQVTVTGTDLAGATGVTFGGVAGTNVNVNASGTQLTVTAPAGAAGAVQVVVTTPGGSSPTNPPITTFTYTYVPPPTVTAITPSSGPLGGGVAVTISGSGFVTGQTTVTFGGNGGTVTNVNANGTQLTVTTPMGSIAGVVDVIVSTPGGSVTKTGGYTYANQPSISSLSPNFGPLTAGTQVTITGTALTGASSVTFGGVSGTNLSVNGSGTQITVSAPTGAAGAVQVVVTAPGGSSLTHPPATTYTYVASPTVTGVAPSSGPLGGGASVTISGTGFVTGQTTVTFGGNGGTVTNVNANGTQLTVTTPVGSIAGVVDVIVSTPGGSVTKTGGYTYANQPSISSLSPAFGPLTSGTQVTITGTALTGASSVTFGGVSGSNISVNGSGTQLTVTAPAGAAGAVQVVVTAPGGSSSINPPASTYTYVGSPTVTGVTPSSGPVGGGASVTISGSGFVNGQTTVTLGGNVAVVTNVNANGTQLTVTTPAANTAGAVNVIVMTPGGSVTKTNGYTYVNIPNISSLSPTFGPIAGGTQVTITGTDFTGVTSVTFGGVPGTNVSVNGNGTQLTVTAPAAFGPAGRVDVEVTTPGGSSDIDPAVTSYTYVAVPTVTGITPSSGPLGGGNLVTLSGTGFVSGQTTVTFNGNGGTVTNVNTNGTQLTVTVPSGTAIGAVTVVVTTPGGSVTKTNGYTYVNQPSISSISPAYGPLTAGTQVTITGTALTAASSVTFGGVPGTNVSVNGNGTQITVNAPSGSAGAVQVVVTTPGGSSPVNSAVTTYTYLAPPTTTGRSPNTGPLAGGSPITVWGTNFVPGQTTIKFGNNVGTITSVDSSTQMKVLTPASSTAGTVSIIVTTPGGSGSTSNVNYTYANVPNVTSLSPAYGPVAGGTQVTINGSGFLSSTFNVTFGGKPAANSVVFTDTVMMSTSPAGTAGAVQVVVNNLGGSSSVNPPATTFTYVAVPTVSGISPSSGPVSGGTSVIISGTGFVSSQTTVTFGNNAGTVTNVNANGTQLTVTTPAGTAAGAVNVVVTTPGGSATQTNGYTYANIPNISGLSPASGPLVAGTQVTITGANFTGATKVTFGGTAGTNMTVNGNGTQITVNAPGASTAGTVQVVVTTPFNSSPLNPPTTTYTYLAPPTATGINPASGPATGGTQVTITGTNLTGASVSFNGVPATNVTVNGNGTQITATTPAGIGGLADVTVVTPGGTITRAKSYSYLPIITNISPAYGSTSGNNQITITGAGFTGITGVMFGSNASPGGNAPNDTQLFATVPAGAAGTVQVVISTAVGSSSINPPTTSYTYVPFPSLGTISPTSGTRAGGTSVIINGTGFVSGQTSVMFGSNTGTVTNVNAAGTQLTVITPAGPVGAVAVSVRTPGGVINRSNGYTYT